MSKTAKKHEATCNLCGEVITAKDADTLNQIAAMHAAKTHADIRPGHVLASHMQFS